jgi:L-asparaginase II
MAYAYARLMATSEEAPGALDRYESSAGHVVEAMTAFPYFVAGSWSMTTPLMEAYAGALLAKEGAEGFYAMAVTPSFASTLTDRLRLADDCAIGIALKIDDGSMTRGRNPVILKTLEILGFDVAAKPELRRYREWPLRNVVGTLVGDVRAEFELEFV